MAASKSSQNLSTIRTAFGLENLHVLVTGACSGIGLEIARAYADAGCTVWVCDANPVAVENVMMRERNLESEKNFNPLAGASVCDVSKEESIELMFEDIRNSNMMKGQLHILVNNAGIAGPTKRVEDILTEEWDQCVNVNIRGTFEMSKHAIRCMQETMLTEFENQSEDSTQDHSPSEGTSDKGLTDSETPTKTDLKSTKLNNSSSCSEGNTVSTVQNMSLNTNLASESNQSVKTNFRLSSKLPPSGTPYSIINIASTAGLYGYPNRAPYCAAKWAVIGFTKTLAIEQGEQQVKNSDANIKYRKPIRCNVICPGTVDNARMHGVVARDAIAQNISEEKVRSYYTNSTCLRSFVQESDIANMAMFLGSPTLAGRITGQVHIVDAGEKMA